MDDVSGGVVEANRYGIQLPPLKRSFWSTKTRVLLRMSKSTGGVRKKKWGEKKIFGWKVCDDGGACVRVCVCVCW